VKAAQSKLDTKKKKLETLQENFKKQSSSLSREAKVSKQEEIIALEKDLKRSFQDTQDQLRRKNAQVVRELLVKLRKVVNDVGDAQSFTVILEKGGDSVLYADNSIDITDTVVKRFDASN
jgi:outer membrane protein